MNIRIEQVVVPAVLPNRRTRRRLPHGLTDARRLAAQIMVRPSAGSGPAPSPRPTRRGASALAVAVAALAVPVLSGTAAAATAPVGKAGSSTTTVAPAPLVRHHLPQRLAFSDSLASPDRLAFSDPSAVTFQSWAASGWSLSGPNEAVDPRCLVIPHHHRCTPWLYHPDAPIRLAGPEVFPDGRAVLDAAVPVSHLSPRAADEPGSPDSVPPSGPDSVSVPDSPHPADSPDPQSGEPTTAQDEARHRTMQPILTAGPAVPATARPMNATCLRAAYLVGKDRRMLAHLRPAVDAMGVVLTHRRAACAAMVDYLSQVRA